MLTTRLARGDAAAANELMPLVYTRLREVAERLMSRERRDHTLQPTALVHEVYLDLVDNTRTDWKGKTHFMGVACMAMGRYLREHARNRFRQKRGGGWQKVGLHDGIAWKVGSELDATILEDSLSRLAEAGDRPARIVELKFFGGLDTREIAEVLGISVRSVERDWRFARAWLLADLQ